MSIATVHMLPTQPCEADRLGTRNVILAAKVVEEVFRASSGIGRRASDLQDAIGGDLFDPEGFALWHSITRYEVDEGCPVLAVGPFEFDDLEGWALKAAHLLRRDAPCLAVTCDSGLTLMDDAVALAGAVEDAVALRRCLEQEEPW